MPVPMRNLLDKATIEGYGVMAPNITNECTARVCTEAAEELHASLILDVGYVFHPDLVFLGRMLEEIAVRSSVPIAANLDHGAIYEQVMWALCAGSTSVMIDRSTVLFEVNVRDIAEVVKAAHVVQVSVEAELGHVGDGHSYGREACLYTDPIQAAEFVKQTSVDRLAISVGTAYGVYAGKSQLDPKRIRGARQAVDTSPVLHGGSGSGDANLQKAVQCGISKINIGTDDFAATIKAGGQAGEPHMVCHRVQQGSKDMVRHYMHIFHQRGKAQKGDSPSPLIKGGILMLSRRQKDILQQLGRVDDFISICILCEACSLSEKTMLSELTVIEAILQEQEIGVSIRKRSSGVSPQLQENKHRQYEMPLHTRQDREETLTARNLFFYDADHVRSERHFCEVLYVGRHVVHGYLYEPSEFCCNYSTVIRDRQKYGILVKGDELHIRDCIITLFMERGDYLFVEGKVGQIPDGQQSKQSQELFQGFLYHPLETCALELEKDCHVYLDHISRLNVFLHLCMCILCVQQKAFVDTWQEQMDMLHKKQRSNRLLEAFETLEATYHILLPEQEKRYIQLYPDIYGLIDGSIFDVVREDLEHTERFHTFVDQSLDILNGILSISIDREEESAEGLLTHLAGTIICLKNGVRTHNPLLHEARSSSSFIYQATWAISILFDQYYSVTITKGEIVYIALYPGVVRERTDYDLRVCFLVKRYDNVIRILREQIQKLYHAIRADDVMTEQEYQNRRQHRRWDLVIATIDLRDDFPQIHVNEILKEEDCLYIRSIANHILDKKTLHNESNLPRADSMLDENLILLEQSVGNKEELSKQICEKLLEAGYVKEPFFSSAMQREREISTEIESGVAISHSDAQYASDTVIVCAGPQKAIPRDRDEHVQHVFLPVIFASNKNEVERSIKNFYCRLVTLIEHGETRRLLDTRDTSEVIACFEDM